jgi:hypothetical protein
MKKGRLFVSAMLFCFAFSPLAFGAGAAGTESFQNQSMVNSDFGFSPVLNLNSGSQTLGGSGYGFNAEASLEQNQSQIVNHENVISTVNDGKLTMGTVTMLQGMSGNVLDAGAFGANLSQSESGKTVLSGFGTLMTAGIEGKTTQAMDGYAFGGGVQSYQEIARTEGYEQFKNTSNGTAYQYGELTQSAIQSGGATLFGGFEAFGTQKATGSTNTFYASTPGTNMATAGMDQKLCASGGANSFGIGIAYGTVAQTLTTGYTQQSANRTSLITQTGFSKSSTTINY